VKRKNQDGNSETSFIHSRICDSGESPDPEHNVSKPHEEGNKLPKIINFFVPIFQALAIILEKFKDL
ncbi:MAG: hypothetical protein LBG95_09105, partial [Treponema sp.]|jgi:hypothetical protein|nr:hypothetical protein [Treponema sp.]